MNCKQIPQQGSSLCSAFVLSFSLIVLTKLKHVERLVSGLQKPSDAKMCTYPVLSLPIFHLMIITTKSTPRDDHHKLKNLKIFSLKELII